MADTFDIFGDDPIPTPKKGKAAKPVYDIFAEDEEAALEEEQEDTGIFDRAYNAGNALVQGYQSNTAGKEYSEAVSESSGRNPFTTQSLRGISVSDYITGGPLGILAEATKALRRGDETAEENNARIAGLRAVAQKEAGEADAAREAVGKNSLTDYITRNMAGVAANPEMLTSTVGGVVGSIAGPGGTAAGVAVGSIPSAEAAFNGAYTEALDEFGATPEEAEMYAYAMTAVEFGTEAIGGKLGSAAISGLGLKSLTKDAAKSGLARVIRSRTGRALGAAASEAGEEILATAGGDVIREGMEAGEMLSTPEAREKLATYNAEQKAKSLERYLDAAGSGALGGGAIGITTGSLAHAAEMGKQEADTTAHVIDEFEKRASPVRKAADERREARATREQEVQTVTKQLLDEQQAAADQKARAEADEQRKADEIEAAYRNQQATPGVVDDIAEAEDRPVTMAERDAEQAPVTAEDIAAERTAAQEAEAARVAAEQQDAAARARATELSKNRDAIAATRKKREADAAKKQADEQRRLRAAETRRRNQVTAEVLDQNPDADDDTLAGLVQDRLDKLGPVVLEPKPVQAPTAPKATKTKPKAKAAPVAPPVAPTAPPAPKAAPGTVDAEIEKASNALGLDLEAKATREDGTVDERPFREKASALVKNINRRNTRESAAVQNLIRQRKLVVAPNPESIGRAAKTSKATYDPDTGTMYLYTDYNDVDTDGGMDAMISAVHEATHAGQDRKRGDRSAVLKSLMGTGKYARAEKLIRQMDGKNALATAAMERVRTAYGNVPAEIQSLEVVPAFVEEAMRARQGYGSLGGVVRDIVSGGRNMLRSAGIPLDVTLADIAAATKNIAEEIVNTDMDAPGTMRSGQEVEMVGGASAPGMAQAEQQGRAYDGIVDGKRRFEFSDAEAELTTDPQVIDAFMDGEPVTLEELLFHDRLYTNYPEAANITVVYDPDMGSANGSYQSSVVSLGDKPVLNMALGDNVGLKSTLLHEIQHFIQEQEGFVGGSNPKMHMPEAVVSAQEYAVGAMNRFLKARSLNDLVSSLPPAAQTTFNTLRDASEALSDDAHKRLYFENGFASDSTDPNIRREQARFNSLDTALDKANDAYNEANKLAFETYYRDYGEAEARNTQDRMNTSQEAIEESGRNEVLPETTMRIDPNILIDSSKYRGGRTAPSVAPLDVERPGTSLDAALGMPGNPQAFTAKTKGGEFTLVDREVAADEPMRTVEEFSEFGTVRETTAYDKDGVWIGTLVYANDGTPPTINVAARVQRQGVGTAMLKLARQQGGMLGRPDTGISGSTRPGYRTDAGQAFRQGADESSVTLTPVQGDLERAGDATRPVPSKLTNRVMPTIKGLFDSSLGTGREVAEILEYAKSSPSATRMEAEGYMGRYRSALRKLAKQRGLDPEALNDQIAAAIEKIDSKTDSYTENMNAFKAAVAPFGQAGRVLSDFRASVDALSLDILKQRAAQGTPLTAKEKKTYSTIRNNLGRYSHRQYAVNLRGAGKEYADAVWDAYATKAKGGKLNPAQAQQAKKVETALTYLVDRITIPQDDVLAEMTAENINYLHDTWSSVPNKGALTTEQKRAELATLRDDVNGDKQLMKAQAETIAQEILGLLESDSMIASYYRGGKQDRGILQERQKISPEIRDLMGEIRDPAMRLFTTAAKQAEFIARTRMLLELRGMNIPRHIQPPGPAGRVEVEGMRPLDSPAFGPMEGYYVSPEMFNLLSDNVEHLATFEQAVAMAAQRPGKLSNSMIGKGLEVWSGVAATTKMLQIVGKPINFLFNFMGGPRTMLLNGNLNPANFAKAIGTATNLITYAANPTAKGMQEAARVNKNGITDSAFIGEINSEQYQELQKTLIRMQGKSPSKAMAIWRTSKKGAVETYAMMDVVYKIANFYQQVNVLTDFYKAAGIKKTADEIDREAADITNRTNVTYKRAAPVVKAMERGGITNFGTFFWEVFRTEINNTRQAFEEIGRARTAPNAKAANVMRLQAAKRLTGQLTVWGLTASAARLATETLFDDDEERDMLRYLLPEYMRDQDFISVGKDKEGNDVLFGVSRVDPAGPITDIMRKVMNEDDDWSTIADSIIDMYVAPRVGTRIVAAVSDTFDLGLISAQKPVLQQLFPEAYSGVLEGTNTLGIDDRTARAWTTVGESWLPGLIDGLKANNAVAVPEDPMSTAANLARFAGGTFYTLNPKTAANGAYDYKDVITDNRKRVAEIVADHPNLTPERLTGRLAGLVQREQEAFTEFSKRVQGMKQLGMTDEEISGLLKDRSVAANAVPALIDGEFTSQTISEKSFKSRAATAVKKKPEAEQEAEQEKWDAAWELLQQFAEQEGDE